MSVLSRLLLAGYVPPPPSVASEAVLTDAGPVPLARWLAQADLPHGALLMLLPTFVGRGPWEAQAPAVRNYFRQIRQLEDRFTAQPVIAVVAMQWTDDEQEAVDRLRSCQALATAEGIRCFVGLSLKARRKMLSLTAAFTIANRADVLAVGWMDDDIRLSDHALSVLWDAFGKCNHAGAIGPLKVGLPRSNGSSRLVARMKRRTEPATNYPHGCCILVEADLVRRGMPHRFVSDDGWVCFELLRPEAPDPMEMLRICREAVCWHEIGAASFGANAQRIRRMQLNHLIFMASYPRAKGLYYLRHILFHGFWPVGVSRKGPAAGVDPLRWLAKALHFLWFSSVAVELVLRGLIGRPLREVSWGGSNDYSAGVKSLVDGPPVGGSP